MQAEIKVMQGCFYWRKRRDYNKFFETENECKINKVATKWEVAYRG